MISRTETGSEIVVKCSFCYEINIQGEKVLKPLKDTAFSILFSILVYALKKKQIWEGENKYALVLPSWSNFSLSPDFWYLRVWLVKQKLMHVVFLKSMCYMC